MRYAIYAAPERDTRLWQFGNRVLGRDAETGDAIAQIVPDGFTPDEWQGFTASPRRYGFHATLKAPFTLREGRSEGELFEAMRTFAASQAPVPDVSVLPQISGAFVFLTPPQPDPRLHALADSCVSEFDAFRASLADDERARRAKGLSAREKENLERWGYPYVFADFQFHLTLAGPLPKERSEDVLAALKAGYDWGVKSEPLAIRSLCVFVEPAANAPFRLALRVPLGAVA